MKRLTDIVWPEIKRMATEEISYASRTVVLEAAVLFEAGFEDMVDERWVVTVSQPEAIKRVVERDGLTPVCIVIVIP
jgi:dephospho-CoA kinase